MLVANWSFFGFSFFSLLIYLTYDFGRGLGSSALILSPPRQSGLR